MRDAGRGGRRQVDAIGDALHRPAGDDGLLREGTDQRRARSTRSPTANPSAAAPTSSTTPASSLPGTNGGGTAIW